ncbi:hypothetical protein [Streptomyces sp. C]|uniref:hypothetical protein n=1 Tax=Streptomyces sp. C TaxID=253839 RepID=UPI0001B54D44|nr:hypothetical protein [Streptomyces sp. C]EFL17287.1 predicted protein [Streptomyces sp. C]
MAVLVQNTGAGWDRELYQTLHDRVLPDVTKPPAGLISHAAMPGDPDGWVVIDVWESTEDYQRFLEDVLIPASQELGTPQFDTKIVEIYNLMVPPHPI